MLITPQTKKKKSVEMSQDLLDKLEQSIVKSINSLKGHSNQKLAK